MWRKVAVIGLMSFIAFIAANWLIGHLETAQAAWGNNGLVLYDGTLGGTPDTQLLEYAAINPSFPPMPAQATQIYSPAIQATILDSTPEMDDMAGYGVTPTIAPILEANNGFKLNFTVRVTNETHTNNDRAGFSITLLSSEPANAPLGIELGFWEDEVWAQEGGSVDLFTHAEGVNYDTASGFVDYELAIIEDRYQLSADGTIILSGPLRDYSAWSPPLPGLPDPYEEPNLIALSDNTTSAAAETWLAAVSIMTDTAPALNIVPSALTISETAGMVELDVQLSYTHTFTTTVNFATVAGTAVAGVDYTAVSGTLTFAPGVSSQTVSVPIINNDVGQLTRQFELELSEPTFARIGDSPAEIAILDDDGGLPEDQVVYLPVLLKP